MHKRIQPRFWVIMISVMVAVFGVSIAAAHHDLKLGAAQLDAANAEYADLQAQVSELQDQLSYVQTDEYIIRTARDELGMVMPGEVRYVSNN